MNRNNIIQWPMISQDKVLNLLEPKQENLNQLLKQDLVIDLTILMKVIL